MYCSSEKRICYMIRSGAGAGKFFSPSCDDCSFSQSALISHVLRPPPRDQAQIVTFKSDCVEINSVWQILK